MYHSRSELKEELPGDQPLRKGATLPVPGEPVLAYAALLTEAVELAARALDRRTIVRLRFFDAFAVLQDAVAGAVVDHRRLLLLAANALAVLHVVIVVAVAVALGAAVGVGAA